MNFLSIKKAYLTNIDQVLEFGSWVQDENLKRTKEILQLSTTIHFSNAPCGETVKDIIWNGEILDKYCEQLLDPNDKGFVYDYGNRLRGCDVDQIEYVIDKLHTCSTSRRAIAVTWRPALDTHQEDVPCMVLLDFKVRNQNLYITGYWRSWDIYGASYANMKGVECIGRYICKRLGLRLKQLHILASSAHIYETDIKQAEQLLKANGG